MATSSRPRALDLVGLGSLSASVLAFEIILLRLFEFSHWYHFAGLAIALAVLGLGAAGTVVALLGAKATHSGDRWFIGSMLIAAAGFLFVLWLNAQFALRPVFAFTDAGELARVLAIDLAAFLPFFGAGLAITQVFPRWPDHPTRLYSANLLGAGLGTIAAALLVTVMSPEAALAIVAATLGVIALVMSLVRRIPGSAVIAVVVLMPAGVFVHDPPDPAVSDFKALSRLADLPESEVLSVRPGLSGRLSVISAPSLRSAPGLSLNWTGAVAIHDAAVIGSDRVIPISSDYTTTPEHAEASLVGLPLALRPQGRVLALGSSTWSTPRMAIGRELTWVEPDRRLTDLVAERGGAFHAVNQGAFRYLATTNSYEVISLDGAFAAGDAASEDYLLTAEGLARALERLQPGGLMAMGIEIEYPPRQAPRLLATLSAALGRHGIQRPGDHVAALRGMQQMLVLVGIDPLESADLSRIRAFAQQWSFDLVWLPDIKPEQTNQHHLLDEPVFYEAARAAFEHTPMPETARWFETRPADIHRPYFWRAMQWQRLPQLFDTLERRAASLLDWTLVMSLAAMVVVTLLAAVLIVLPLGRLPPLKAPFGRASVAGYFLALGMGFMLVELAIFQRLLLYLERPVLAAAVVFALFLIGAGIGAAMPPKRTGRAALRRIFAMLAIGAVAGVAVVWLATDALLAAPLGIRIALLAGVLLPLTWAMGRPLPWALGQLSRQPRWIPWGWAINGFASVFAASLAPLISVHYGQPVTLLAGAGCYLAAWAIARGWVTTESISG